MKYIAAYCLLVLGGKQDPTESDLSSFLKSIDCEVDEEQVKVVCQALKGKQLHELANQGIDKIASMSVAAGPAPTQQTSGPAKTEAKKEEEVVEEEEAVDFGDLFG